MPPAAIVDPNPKSATRLSWAKLIRQWIQYLAGGGGSIANLADFLNGSFESSADGITPDNWSFTPFTNGAGAIDTSTSEDGTNSFKITAPGGGGNGGGYLDSYISGGSVGALIPWSPDSDFWVSWAYKASVATMSNKVEVRWWDSSKLYISSSTLWSASSGQPSSWTPNAGNVLAASIPSNARYASIRFTGGQTGSDAGSVWYDEVKVFYPASQGKYQIFTSDGTFTTGPRQTSVTVDLISGGAGGGGRNTGTNSCGGGGGGGAYSRLTMNVLPNTSYTVTVGQGGTGGSANAGGADGGDSSFNGYTVTGGKGGGAGTGVGGTGGAAGSGYAILPTTTSGALVSCTANGTAGTAGANISSPGGNGGSLSFVTGVTPFTSGTGGAGAIGSGNAGSGTNYGAGGGGQAADVSSNSGNGSPGIVVVYY